MRILHLRAENFKRIQVIDITPKGDVIQITGPNASGKSSVLDSIMALVGGKAACPSEPIRHGEKKATIIADLGNYVVKRTFTPDGKTTITVETQDGARFGSAQKLLDEFLGSLSFDPLEFARMKPKDQYETIRQVAGIGAEIDRIDAQIKEEYEERASWNRQAKEAKAAASGIEVPDDLPDERLNMAAMAEEMEQATARNGVLSRYKLEHESDKRRFDELQAGQLKPESVQTELDAAHARMEKRTKELEQQIESIRLMIANTQQEYTRECKAIQDKDNAYRRKFNDDLSALKKKIEDDTAKLVGLVPVDVLEIKERMANAEYYNSGIANREKRQEYENKAENAEKMSKTLTASMEARAQEKQNIIARSKLPIEGIDLKDGEVRYKGVPFAQASDAERLRVSVALAMAMNPKLRVIRLKDGGLLDSSSMKILAEMARANDHQVWIEVVDETKAIGIVMEDGKIIADNQTGEALDEDEEG